MLLNSMSHVGFMGQWPKLRYVYVTGRYRHIIVQILYNDHMYIQRNLGKYERSNYRLYMYHTWLFEIVFIALNPEKNIFVSVF